VDNAGFERVIFQTKGGREKKTQSQLWETAGEKTKSSEFLQQNDLTHGPSRRWEKTTQKKKGEREVGGEKKKTSSPKNRSDREGRGVGTL